MGLFSVIKGWFSKKPTVIVEQTITETEPFVEVPVVVEEPVVEKPKRKPKTMAAKKPATPKAGAPRGRKKSTTKPKS